MGFFDRLKKGLSKSRGNLTERVDELVDKLDTLSEQLKTIWAEENPSLLKLSLLALTVMPGISMTDTVMVDGGTRTRVPSFRAKENADGIN